MAWIKTLFAKMAAIYDKRWSDKFTSKYDCEVAMEEWFNTLREFKISIIINAIDRLKCSGNAYPPNLIEFYELCKSEREKDRKKYFREEQSKNRYEPISYKTRRAFLDAVDKCSENGRQDLCDKLCALLAQIEEKGALVE
jgi:hypothetical protein